MSKVTISGGSVIVAVEETVADVRKQMKSRGYRAENELRNAALEVLIGQRSGRVYKKADRASLHTASAPGEPPAKLDGNLRENWKGDVREEGDTFVPYIENLEEKYPYYMEHGTPGGLIAPRPYVDRIRDKALPAIKKIYEEPYV